MTPGATSPPPLERCWPSIPSRTPHSPIGKPTNGSPEHPDPPRLRRRGPSAPTPSRPSRSLTHLLQRPQPGPLVAAVLGCGRGRERDGRCDLGRHRGLLVPPVAAPPAAAQHGRGAGAGAGPGVCARCRAKKLSGAGRESGGGGVASRERGRDEGRGRRDPEGEGGAKDGVGRCEGAAKGAVTPGGELCPRESVGRGPDPRPRVSALGPCSWVRLPILRAVLGSRPYRSPEPLWCWGEASEGARAALWHRHPLLSPDPDSMWTQDPSPPSSSPSRPRPQKEARRG